MNIIIQNRNMEHSKTLNEFIEKKFSKLKQYNAHIDKLEIVMSVNKLEHHAEARLHIKEHSIFADSSTESMYKTIDTLLDKVVKLIQKHKSMNENH